MERLIGNLWLVRGNLFDDYVETDSPLIVLPAYTNRGEYEIVEKFAAAYPPLRKIAHRRHDQEYLEPCSTRVRRVGSRTFLVIAHSFYSGYGELNRHCECPIHREWHTIQKAVKTKGCHSVHWLELNDPTIVDVPALVFRLFFGLMVRRPQTQYIYYNEAWPYPPSEEII